MSRLRSMGCRCRKLGWLRRKKPRNCCLVCVVEASGENFRQAGELLPVIFPGLQLLLIPAISISPSYENFEHFPIEIHWCLLSCCLELYCKMRWMTKQYKKLGTSLLEHKEYQALKSLNTPAKIQDFLNKLPFNHEKRGETHYSVEEALRNNTANCFEGALIAAAALQMHGWQPLILDLKVIRPDFDHLVALFKVSGHWGAISKTNHAVLRYREPVYKSIRELAMSYFHEYFLPNGKKTLRSYSKPFDLSKMKINWLTGKESLADLAHLIDKSPHTRILSPKQERNLRKADEIEIRAGQITDII